MKTVPEIEPRPLVNSSRRSNSSRLGWKRRRTGRGPRWPGEPLVLRAERRGNDQNMMNLLKVNYLYGLVYSFKRPQGAFHRPWRGAERGGGKSPSLPGSG